VSTSTTQTTLVIRPCYHCDWPAAPHLYLVGHRVVYIRVSWRQHIQSPSRLSELFPRHYHQHEVIHYTESTRPSEPVYKDAVLTLSGVNRLTCIAPYLSRFRSRILDSGGSRPYRCKTSTIAAASCMDATRTPCARKGSLVFSENYE
jgi:hypothetical protein